MFERKMFGHSYTDRMRYAVKNVCVHCIRSLENDKSNVNVQRPSSNTGGRGIVHA